MKRTRLYLLMLFLFVFVGQTFSQTVLVKPEVEKKVDSVMALMTLEEKVGQLNQHNGAWEFTGPVPEGDYQQQRFELMKKGGVGSMLNVVGAEATREAQKVVMENSRLGIPLIFGYDVIHGFKTIFPIPLGESASWDLEVLEQSARVAAKEASAAGLHWTFAPMIDLSRDARWGRVMEGSGEDPYLTSRIAEARIRGFQTDDLYAKNSIAATAKHFAAYGFAEAGRDYNTAEISRNTLLNHVLPPFKAATDAGVVSVMNSFNDMWGIPATADKYLQTEKLKNEWGFNGFIVSDWGSIREMIPHGYSKDLKTAAEDAIEAGNDMDMESEAYQNHLVDLVESGQVDEALIDESVRRILRAKFLLGLFEDPYRYSDPKREKKEIYTKENRKIARDVARKSIVLLNNEGELLPIDPKKRKKIAVIGKLADDKDTPIGSWRGQGEANSAVSVLEGIKDAVGRRVEVEYAQGYKLAVGERSFTQELEFADDDGSGFDEAVSLAKESDLVVMVVGEEGFQTGEGRSQVDISLKGRQLELMKKIKEANSNVAVVLMNGRPVAEPWMYENMPALLETWHLGTEAGNAIADVLFGEYNPSGKLPMSIPRHVGQTPIYYNHKNTGRPGTGEGDAGTVFWSHYTDESNAPQYPFGYGLSYTTFEYSEAQLSSSEMAAGESVTLTVTVSNTGEYKGSEVVQLYIRDHYASRIRPVKELRGFEKITLEPGTSQEVTFTIDEETLSYYNGEEEFVAEPGAFSVMVGTSSEEVQMLDLQLK